VLSERGKKVLVVDGDYFAPCLDSFFPDDEGILPFTDYLRGETKFEDVVARTGFGGLWVSYAPAPSFSQEILQAGAKTHGKYLKRILAGFKTAHSDLGFDEIVIDNSSGISLPALNFLSSSQKSFLVIRPVRYGVESTYNLINAIYRKLRYTGSKSVRKDFLVWNQVPIQAGSSLEPRIKRYLDYWTDKFADVGIMQGPTIPYIFDVVASMIAESTFDVPRLTGFIGDYVEDLADLLE
jgi:MinD-like ATPase involved in chromosome partitioning or flagellar assembly